MKNTNLIANAFSKHRAQQAGHIISNVWTPLQKTKGFYQILATRAGVIKVQLTIPAVGTFYGQAGGGGYDKRGAAMLQAINAAGLNADEGKDFEGMLKQAFGADYLDSRSNART